MLANGSRVPWCFNFGDKQQPFSGSETLASCKERGSVEMFDSLMVVSRVVEGYGQASAQSPFWVGSLRLEYDH